MERVQAFTNPLWTLLLTVPSLLPGNPYYGIVALSVLLSGLALYRVLISLSVGWQGALFAGTALGLSKAFVDFATSGLENPLTYLLLVLFWERSLRADEGPARLSRLSFLGALAMVNRLDNVFYVAPALAYEVWKGRREWAIRAGLLGLWPILLWEAFSLVYYGFPFPNTYYAKLHTGIPEREYLQQGLRYLANFASEDSVGFALVAGALLVVALTRARKLYLPALGILLHSLYVLHVGGDFMIGRFFSATVLGSVVLLVRTPLGSRPRAVFLLFLAALGLGVSNPHSPLFIKPSFHRGGWNAVGIADEKGFYFPRMGLLSSDHAPPVKLKDAGKACVDTAGMVGFSAWSQGALLHTVDRWPWAILCLLGCPRPTCPSGVWDTTSGGFPRVMCSRS